MLAMGGLPDRESGLAGNIDIAQLDDGSCKLAKVRQGKVRPGHGWAMFAFAPVHRDGGQGGSCEVCDSGCGKDGKDIRPGQPWSFVHIRVIAHQPKTINLPDNIPGPIAFSCRYVCSLLVSWAGTASPSLVDPVWPVCRRFSETHC
jgi:hypothetical protein